ncbi:putative inner membrane transporter YedA [Dyadobacter sp. CECT 9275]|uniref:Inner membrane transporter YedA n=2 Tax=Dyadobacter helix TaxID=2822344 RepID=A0A916JI51_9BACT|nr:putative inner membrane transporter YedA [Dyadobacter sp. CECT 9275]
MIILAYAIVYIVWGSTYFFIQKALSGFPPFLLGAFRFIAAGILLMGWSVIQGEKILVGKKIIPSAITGFLLLFVGNGIVIWVEQFLPSAMVAILISSAPLWFVLLDKPKWQENLNNKLAILGLVIGFGGVILLFSERVTSAMHSINSGRDLFAMGLILFSAAAWAGGSLYAKYNASNTSPTVNTSWQMMTAGVAFIPGLFISGELSSFDISAVPLNAWLSVLYLVIFGSIVAFSSYVWLIKVQPATKVSTYAYVNPVVAVLLGILFGGESISLTQISGLIIILGSVLLINFDKYRSPVKTTSASA